MASEKGIRIANLISRPYVCAGLCLIAYSVPLAKELFDGEGPLANLVWYAYIFPAILLSYNYGLRGGVANAITSAAIAVPAECYEHFYRHSHDFIAAETLDSFLMVGLTSVMSLAVGVMADSLKQKEHEAKQRYEASIRDALTGLYNYGFFQERLQAEFEAARRSHWPLTLLFVDVDRFKEYNDTFGHFVANQALYEIAQTLRATFRETDIVARYGGDEFAVILPRTGPQEAEAIAERALRNIAAARLPQGCLTVSVGIATYPNQANDVRSLVEFSDEALYQAKGKGRNVVVVCSDAISLADQPGGFLVAEQ
ncbi:MAG: GGDEF domain-containing protein [Clostridia bacterium]|nr:GGDEF domain-containing protein [Clostridia bacterium]